MLGLKIVIEGYFSGSPTPKNLQFLASKLVYTLRLSYWELNR
jgi:hypothetical protein